MVDSTWISTHFDFNSFRIYAFLDDFALRTARPSSPLRRDGIFIEAQRAFYSGYLRAHGLKAQIVFLPIGIIGSVFITELRQNDNGVQNMSGLNNYLVDVLLVGILIGGLLPALYGDGIFAVLAAIVPRYVNPSTIEALINLRMSSVRVIVEHVLGDHSNFFKLFAVPRYLRLYVQKYTLNRG